MVCPKSMFSSFVIFGHPSNSLNQMTWSLTRMNVTQIKACDHDVNIITQKKRRGVYWSYEDVNRFYGPFKSDSQAINDAKTYSTYGTTNKRLISSPT